MLSFLPLQISSLFLMTKKKEPNSNILKKGRMAARFALNAKEYSLNQRRQQVFNLSCSLSPFLQISLFYKSIIGLLTPPSSHVGKEERNSRAISLASIHPTLNLAAKLFQSFVLVLPLRLSLSVCCCIFLSFSQEQKSLSRFVLS